MDVLEDVLRRAQGEIAKAESLAELDQIRVRFVGKKGTITEQMKTLGGLPAEERKAAGAQINRVRPRRWSSVSRIWRTGRLSNGLPVKPSMSACPAGDSGRAVCIR